MSQLLGIDLGTSSVKVLLTTPEGQILGRGKAEYPIYHPRPHWAEQDPSEWWQATCQAVQQLQALTSKKNNLSVVAIGLSGQMHGTVLLNKAGHLLNPAIIWSDQRSQSQVEEITALIGPEKVIELTGSPLFPGFQAATLYWIRQHQPDIWRKIAMVLLPKDYLRWQLTGTFGTDPSDGSGTLLFDLQQRTWATELLNILSLHQEQLPPIYGSSQIVGYLSPAAAHALHLTPGIPVVTGSADTASGLLGANSVDSQTLFLNLGTGAQLIIPAQKIQLDRTGRLHTFCSAFSQNSAGAAWYQMAATLSAGLALRWLRDRIFELSGEVDAYTQMFQWAESVPPGANGLLFLPYLIGERTPLMDSKARGLFLGLSNLHGRPEMVRAVIEGVTLACYDAYLALVEVGAKPERIVLAGGGSQSRLWQQIIADIFGLPVQALVLDDLSALGAVLLAGAGIGLFEEPDQKWTTHRPLVRPQAQYHTFYQDRFRLFRRAYQQHQQDFPHLVKTAHEGV